eukprot:2261299-Pyramimonas_sp.AAC.1
MEGGRFPNCGSRFSAVRIRFKDLQGFHGLRAACFQNVPPVVMSRTFFLKGVQELHGWRAVAFQYVALAWLTSQKLCFGTV